MSILTNSGFSHVLDKIYSLFAKANHKHTTSDISDFPKSLPASDVSSWAKQVEKPTYTASEVGATSAIEISQVDYNNLKTKQKTHSI